MFLIVCYCPTCGSPHYVECYNKPYARECLCGRALFFRVMPPCEVLNTKTGKFIHDRRSKD